MELQISTQGGREKGQLDDQVEELEGEDEESLGVLNKGEVCSKHYITHFPYNPHCWVCRQAKLKKEAG